MMRDFPWKYFFYSEKWPILITQIIKQVSQHWKHIIYASVRSFTLKILSISITRFPIDNKISCLLYLS